MARITTADLKFKAEKSGLMGTTKSDTEYIASIIKRLMYTIPGTDDYDPDWGLDIRSQLMKQHKEGAEDGEYASRIHEQLLMYTDIYPLNVRVWYSGKSVIVGLVVRYNNQVYTLNLSADQNNLGTLIEPVI